MPRPVLIYPIPSTVESRNPVPTRSFRFPEAAARHGFSPDCADGAPRHPHYLPAHCSPAFAASLSGRASAHPFPKARWALSPRPAAHSGQDKLRSHLHPVWAHLVSASATALPPCAGRVAEPLAACGGRRRALHPPGLRSCTPPESAATQPPEREARLREKNRREI